MKPILGIIGLGQIGGAVALNLLEAEFSVLGYRRNPDPAFGVAGGKMCGSVAEVCEEAQVIMTCLPGEEEQSEVLFGQDGILSANLRGKCVIELGTYRKAFKLKQAEALQNQGAAVLEAEVSGSPGMVRHKSAALYIGADAETFESHDKILAAIAGKRFLIGPYGSAVEMKLIANYLLTIHTLAAAEAIDLGTKAGFDPKMVADVIGQGAGASAMFEIRAPLMVARQFSPAPGPFKTLDKYLDLCQRMVDDNAAEAPLFSAARPLFKQAIDEGLGEEDIAAVIKMIERKS